MEMNRFTEKLKYEEIVRAEDMGKYIGNYKWQINILSYALRHKDKVESIISCAQVFHNSDMVAHFVVKLKNGKYIDPTYGSVSSVMYNYLIPIQSYKVDTFMPNREPGNLQEYMRGLLP